jgi:hypothetical protein
MEMSSKKKPLKCRYSVVQTPVQYCSAGWPAELADHPTGLAFLINLEILSKTYKTLA